MAESARDTRSGTRHMTDMQTTTLSPSTQPNQLHQDARQILINTAWQTTRRALLMLAAAWQKIAETYRDRNASIASDMAHAAANAIERRLK